MCIRDSVGRLSYEHGVVGIFFRYDGRGKHTDAEGTFADRFDGERQLRIVVLGAVYTENQTAGRGRLGRSWVNAEGKALYYTAAIREPLAQPATLPLLASLAVRTQLKLRYGVDCQIKWPNDLLLNGKKIVGILCEGVSYGYQQQGRGILCGIGINLAQPQSYFDAAGLPNGTSLALQGAKVDPVSYTHLQGGRGLRSGSRYTPHPPGRTPQNVPSRKRWCCRIPADSAPH